MNAKTIKNLIVGLIVLALASVSIYLYQDVRVNIKVSQRSTINANSYVLGVDYSGLITEELVKKGDFVHKGDKLAYLKSTALLSDLNSNKISKQDLIYPLSSGNEIIIQATQDGVIDQENFLAGSYVPANQNIFKISADQSPYVISEFNLTRTDFQRLNKSSQLQIKLPNGRLVNSAIDQITVDSSTISNGPTVLVTIQSFIQPDANLLIGSPVTATLHLSQDTKLQAVINYLKRL